MFFLYMALAIIIAETGINSVELNVHTDFLRDINKYPLSPGESGEVTNMEPDKCNNFNYRKDNTTLKYIVQHHTDCNFSETISIFLNLSTSSHYVIDYSGWIEEMVSPNFRAYHAGAGNLSLGSKLNPKTNLNNDMNSWSIGIENVNNAKEPFPFSQIKANLLLCDKLCDEIPTLDPILMIGHSDWAPGRKIDVSVFFPWELFANAKEISKDWEVPIKRNFGVFPRISKLNLSEHPEPIIFNGTTSKGISKSKIEEVQELLLMYGYSIDESELGEVGDSTQNAILSYNIHFKGQEVVRNKLEIWKKFADGDLEMKDELIEFNENDFICLRDILNQFPGNKTTIN